MDFFRDVGWPMFPELLLGLTAVGLAIAHAARPTRGLFWSALGVGIGVVLFGLLGTLIGLIHSFAAVAGVDPSMKATLLPNGISEAMSCTSFAVGLTIIWLPPLLIVQVRVRRDRVSICM